MKDTATPATVSVTLRDLVVRFGATAAVAGVSLEIQAGELFMLLGPSGCGKTTLLRAVAGFAPVDAGRVLFGAEDVTLLPAHRRNAGMVFQSFALWPHLTVAENVAFGLRERRVPPAELSTRVEEALASTRMQGYGPRRIDELSGGEQQRVALARALVVRPRCLLLDEPLSNLDARLRRSMRDEIRRICKAFGLTTLYVTHDQKEALAIADRIAVMDQGRVLQVGSPSDIYRRPRSRAVAAFVGETNLLRGRVVTVGSSELQVETPIGTLVAASEAATGAAAGAEVWVSIRPEGFRRGAAPADRNTLRGRPASLTQLGELVEVRFQVGDVALVMVELNHGVTAASSEGLSVHVEPGDVVLLPLDGAPGA